MWRWAGVLSRGTGIIKRGQAGHVYDVGEQCIGRNYNVAMGGGGAITWVRDGLQLMEL